MVWHLMLILRCLALAAVFFSIGTIKSFAASWNATKQQQIETLASQLINGQKPPSAVIGVSIDGETVWHKGYGAIAPGKAPDINTAYRIGSVSKQFTALAVLKLIEDGAQVPFSKQPLSLSTPVSQFFTNVDHWGAVQVRHLLTMTSGIPNHIADPLAISVGGGPRSAQGILARIKQFTSQGFGSFNYSNSNYFLLAHVIEIVRGAGTPAPPPSYSTYLHQKIFEPAAMHSTYVIGDAVPPSASQALPVHKTPAMFFAPEWPKGAGHMVSTVADLLKWDDALSSGTLCNASTLQSMLSPAAPMGPGAGSGSYAMGWIAYQTPAGKLHQHGGAIAGYTASNTIATLNDGTKVAVVVLTNTDQVNHLETFARDVVATIAQ